MSEEEVMVCKFDPSIECGFYVCEEDSPGQTCALLTELTKLQSKVEAYRMWLIEESKFQVFTKLTSAQGMFNHIFEKASSLANDKTGELK